ncbi:MAG: nitrate/nitrite transporter NrtS [Campylobacteraceae bacterium]|nr:nitrate/nitrite transporter NrtS [Campylobacteraceae bacterium]
MGKFTLISHILCNRNIFYKASKIAIVVGIILNLINQGEYIIHFDFENINYYKLGLTFMVPFCVSTYTAITMKMKYHVGEKALLCAILTCETCHGTQEVKRDEIIPFCHKCHDKTSWKIKEIKETNVNCRD